MYADKEYILSLRHEIHEYPEIGFGLPKTIAVVKRELESLGIEYTEEFGEDTRLSPRNLIETKKFEVTTPDVTIKVNPERSDLIETRVIGGIKYILINADEDVEVNGVSIHIKDKEPAEV